MDQSSELQPNEPVEGLDDSGDVTWGEYPIDTLLIRNETRTVHDILRRIEQKTFVMNPDFQRDFIWDDAKQSKLIESVLMRIPLPVFYLAEDKQGRMIVVDGLQRLSTFQNFVQNNLRLKLPDQEELNKRLFKDIPPKLQNRVEDCNLILYVIDAKVPERAKLDIFERVNSGVPLTRQQMRNCLYMGQATMFLKDEANTELFREVTGNSLRSDTMRDREFVNRFCAFKLLLKEDYKGDMDQFLATALERLNEKDSTELEALREQFRTALTNNKLIFGEHAFRKVKTGKIGRSLINASLWDVMSVCLSSYQAEQLVPTQNALLERFYALMDDVEFVKSITYATNDVARVRHRFAEIRKILTEVVGASPA